MGEGFEGLVEDAHPNASPPRRGDFPKLFLEFSKALPDLPTTTKVIGL